MATFTKHLVVSDLTGNLKVSKEGEDILKDPNFSRYDQQTRHIVPNQVEVRDSTNVIFFSVKPSRGGRVSLKSPWKDYCAFQKFELGDLLSFSAPDRARVITLTVTRNGVEIKPMPFRIERPLNPQ